MVGLYSLILLAVLGAAAVQDYRKHEISDVLSALVWVVAMSISAECAQWIAVCFGLLLLVSSVYVWKFKKPFISWADILIIPPIAGAVIVLGIGFFASVMLFFIALLIMIVLIKREKGWMPIIPVFFLTYALALLFSVIFPA